MSESVQGAMSREAELASVLTLIFNLPRQLTGFECFAAVPGMGERWRTKAAVDAFEVHRETRHLLVVGINPKEATYVNMTEEVLRQEPYNLSRRDGVVTTQGSTANTKTQAEWFVEQVVRLKLKSCAIFVSPYHIVRVFGTILAAFERAGVEPILLIPSPVLVSPFRDSPEQGKPMYELVASEAEKWFAYQTQGDITSLARLLTYFRWVYEQPLITRQLYS